MRFLKFINRVAFICNICFLLMFVLKQIQGIDKYQTLVGTLVVLGFGAIIVNAIALLISLIAVVLGKKNQLPMSIFLLNVVFFLLQIFFFLASTK
jgi:hypothetical protein